MSASYEEEDTCMSVPYEEEDTCMSVLKCLVEVTRLAVRLFLLLPKRRVFEEDVARDTLEALSMPALAQNRNPRVHCIHTHTPKNSQGHVVFAHAPKFAYAFPKV